jgi:hypothetical protein
MLPIARRARHGLFQTPSQIQRLRSGGADRETLNLVWMSHATIVKRLHDETRQSGELLQ